jgi:hypothetical protein
MLRCLFHGCRSTNLNHIGKDKYQCNDCHRVFIIKAEERKSSNSGFRDRLHKHPNRPLTG